VLEAMASPQNGENDESGQWRRQFGNRITDMEAKLKASQAQLAARMEAKLDLLLSQMVQTASDVRLVHNSGGE
jgi:hypothetical protein